MTKEGYSKMVRGINNEGDFPPEFISAIYDEIARNGIKMKGNESRMLKERVGTTTKQSVKQREVLATLELEAMSETARALMENASMSDSFFTKAEHQHHAKPMFKVTCFL